MKKPVKVLFLCNDSFRSQMARAWTIHFNKQIKAYAVGVNQTTLDRFAEAVMREADLPLMSGKSINIRNLANYHFDYVVTLCPQALERLPALPSAKMVFHIAFDDPVQLSQGLHNEAVLDINRRVRDEIRDFIQDLSMKLTHIDPP